MGPGREGVPDGGATHREERSCGGAGRLLEWHLWTGGIVPTWAGCRQRAGWKLLHCALPRWGGLAATESLAARQPGPGSAQPGRAQSIMTRATPLELTGRVIGGGREGVPHRVA